MGKKRKTVTDDILEGLNVDPQSSEQKKVNDDVVDAFTIGAINYDQLTPKPAGGVVTKTPGGPSKYDVGYTPEQENLDEFRAINQTGMDQFGNRMATLVPKVGVGVAELAGHIAMLPANIHAMTNNGLDIEGKPHDFDNFMSKWARDKSEELRQSMPVYRENPEKTWDLGDTGWWMDSGFDTVESIAEFLITGAGVAKTAGAVSETMGTLTKGIINADMVGAGIKLSEKMASATGGIINSAATSESIAALNAAQNYQAVYDEVIGSRKDDGSLYSDQEAKEIASHSASNTFKTTLFTATALNITSLAPFARKSPKRLNVSSRGKTASTYKEELKNIKADPSRIANGQKLSKWWNRHLQPSGIVGEALQEGVEEVSENVASDSAMMDANVKLGREDESMDLFSAENGLAFALGAFGGGVAKGFGSAYKAMTNQDEDKEFENFLDSQIDALDKHEVLSGKLQDLQAKDLPKASKKEFADNLSQIRKTEIELVANAVTSGLDNGTFRIMEEEIKSMLTMSDDDANAMGIDKENLQVLQASISKHKKIMEDLQSSPQDAKTQMLAVNASIKKDLFAGRMNELRAVYNDLLSSYTGEKAEIANNVNRHEAMKAAKKENKLAKDRKKVKDDFAEIVSGYSEEDIAEAKNENLINAAYMEEEAEFDLAKAAEDFSKLNNPDTSAEHAVEMEKDDADQVVLAQNATDADAIVADAASIINESVSASDIDSAIKMAEGVLSKNISDDQKTAIKGRINSLKNVADVRKKKIRKDNKTKNLIDNADPNVREVAEKNLAGEELNEDEKNLNAAKSNEVANIEKAMASLVDQDTEVNLDQANIPPELQEGEDFEVIPTDLPEDIPVVDFTALPEDQINEPSGDKVAVERPVSDETRENIDINKDADQEPETIESAVDKDDSVDHEQEISTFQKEISYFRFKEKGKEIKSAPGQVRAARELLATLLDKQARNRTTAWDRKKILLLSDQLKRVDAGLQERVFMPVLNDDLSFRVHDLTNKNTGENVPVTDIFESVGGHLLVNTTQVLPGQEVEIVYNPDWEYFTPKGVDPILIYRVIDGKRAAKPIAELPFANLEPGSLEQKIRDDVARGIRSPFNAYISGKNYGDLVTETKGNGQRADNPITAAVTSEMPMTFGFIDSEKKYMIENLNPSLYNRTQRIALGEFYGRFVRPTDRTMGVDENSRAPGTHFILTIAPNGKIVPVYMDSKTLSEEDVNKLTGTGTSGDSNKNIADILATGRSIESQNTSTGIVNLKKLMSIGATIDNDVTMYLTDKGDSKDIVATPNGLLWKTNAIPDVPNGSWIRIDYNVPTAEENFNPLANMLAGKNFTYQVLSGENYQKIPGQNNDYYKVDGGSSIAGDIVNDLKRVLSKSKYNISKDFMNTPNFVDAFGESTGKSYNEFVNDKNWFTTDVTTASNKFINANIKLRLTGNIATEDQLTSKIKVPEPVAKGFVSDVLKYKIATRAEEGPEPTEDNPVPDQEAEKKLSKVDKARRRFNDDAYLRQPDSQRGFARMSKAEVEWLADQVGRDNLNIVHGVDRVLTTGGREALGFFHNSMITLAGNAEMGTGYHEAFHFVFHMALNSKERSAVLKQARSRYGDKSNRILEEDLAEDFRTYMLESEREKRPSAIARFFKNILSYIEKIIGLSPRRDAQNSKTDILSFYDQISTGDWKSKYKNQFSQSLDPTYRRYKLIKHLSMKEQNEIIGDAMSEVVNIAEEFSSDYQSFADIVSNRARLNEIIDQVKEKFELKKIEIVDQADYLQELDRDLTEEEDKILYQDYVIGKVLDSWDITDEQKKEVNPPVSFKNELIKSLSRFGFQVSVRTTYADDSPITEEEGILIDKDTNSLEDQDNEIYQVEGSPQEHIYNVDITLKDTKKTVSLELKRRLSMLPVYQVDSNGRILKDENGNFVEKKNLFGNPTRHDFNSAYSNIKSVLADTPIEMIYDKVVEEAKNNPLFAAIEYNMNREISKDSTAGDHWNGFISEFMSAFSNSTYNLMTIRSSIASKTNKPMSIFADRATIYRRINDRWEQKAQSMGLLDFEFNAQKEKWAKINEEYQSDLEVLGFEPEKGKEKERAEYNSRAVKMLKKYLSATGFEFNSRALPLMKKENGGSYESLLRGKYNSLESIIHRGTQGTEKPFGKESVLNKFSKPQSGFENDINSGTLFANGKQMHSVNMPSFISDAFNSIRSEFETNSPGLLNMLNKDQFYVPDPSKPELNNLFYDYISNPENIKNAKIIQLLDFKDGKEGKEYINTNFEQSFLQKVIAGSQRNIAYFSLGTLSDKLKSIAIQLPVSNTLEDAKEKYKDSLLRTIYQEISRINKVKSNPEFAKRYKSNDADKFVYLPELNAFPELFDKIIDGDIDTELFNETFREKILPVIDRKIEEDLAKEMNRLVFQGVLVEADIGYVLSESAGNHLGVKGNSPAGIEMISKFLIEDRMWKMEMSKVFMGDLAKYKNFWDYFKRMYQLVTPGRKTYVNPQIENASHKATMNRLIIKSPHSSFGIDELSSISSSILANEDLSSRAHRELEKMIAKEPKVKEGDPVKSLSEKQVLEITNEIAKKGSDGPKLANALYIAYSYRSNNRGDAASFVSIEFFRDQKKGLGDWNKDYEWIYQNVWSRGITVEQATEDMTEEQKAHFKAKDVKLTADVLKPFYYGPRLETIPDNATGNPIQNVLYEQFKDAMAPILPIWGRNISGFDWMLQQFDRGVDVISTDDTVKQGEFDAIEMGSANEEVDSKIRVGIPTSYLRYPQVPAKIKDFGLAGTQLQKIIMSNLNVDADYSVGDESVNAQDLSRNYHKAFSRKIKRSFRKVLKDLGFSGLRDLADMSTTTGPKKLDFLLSLRRMVEESVISQGKSENFIDALNIVDLGDGKYEYDLGMSFDAYSRSYQNIIMSVVRNNILKQELPGGSMVNMADLSTQVDDTLRFVRQEQGRIMPAEIAMPHVHAKTIGVGWGITNKDGEPTVDYKGNVIRENLEDWQKQALKVVLYRIPTQMKSSTLPTVIKRILPPSDGAKVMIPGEMTTQAGLDFDFDKSFMLFKVFGKDSNPKDVDYDVDKMNNSQLDNYIFDVHWSVLTNPSHFEELVTPVSSRTHDQLIETLPQETGSAMDTTDPFNSVTNIEMEGLAKYSHIMRGTFSKFAAGHNVMNNIVTTLEGTGKTINDYISPSVFINIDSGNPDYRFDQLGRQRDSEGRYISENHSENLNSALDSQKDPKLGKLNTSVFNSMATGYMVDMGVPDRLVKLFMNSPILKALSHEYFKLGGVPFVLKDAVDNIVTDRGIQEEFSDARKSYAFRMLNEVDFKDGADAGTEAAILSSFIQFNIAGNEMAKINDLLSPETQKIADAAGLRDWMAKQSSVFKEDNTIKVNEDLFKIGSSPLEKVSSFHKYGIDFSKFLSMQIFPYFTKFYDDTIDGILRMQNKEGLGGWKLFDRLHSMIDLMTLSKTARKNRKDVLSMISPGFRERLSIYRGTDKPTIVDEYDRMFKKYPALNRNAFIASLTKDKYNNRNITQLLNFPNATDNNEQSKIIAGLSSMIQHSNDEIRQFAHDLIAYTVATSGFSKNSHSFIMMVPTSFWRDSGVSALMKEAKVLSEGNSIVPDGDTGHLEAIIRSIGASSSVVPSLSPDDKIIAKKGYIIVPGSNKLIPNDPNKSPMFIKRYSSEKKRMILYRRNDELIGDSAKHGILYEVSSFFGEEGRSHEMFNMGTFIPRAESEVSIAQRRIDGSKEAVIDLPQDPIDGIPNTEDELEAQDSGLFTEDEMSNIAIDPDNDIDLPLFSLDGTRVSSRFDEQVNQRLDAFLKNNNISVEIVESMKERFGVDATGAADAVNQAIYLAKGKEGDLSKPEEVAHIYIESTLDSRQTKRLLDNVEGTEEMVEVRERYSDLYENDEYRLKKEAAAKILSKYLTDPQVYKKSNRSKIQRAIDAFMNMIKRLFGVVDPFFMSAKEILQGQVLRFSPTNAGTMFKMTGEDSDFDLESAFNSYNEESAISEALEEQAMQNYFDYGMTQEELDIMQEHDPEVISKDINKTMKRVTGSLKRKIARLDKSIASNIDVGDSKALRKTLAEMISKMEIFQDSQAMVQYIEDVNRRIKIVSDLFDKLNAEDRLTNEDLFEMDQEVASFENVRYIQEYLAENQVSSQIEDQLKETIAFIMAEKSILEAKISRKSIRVTAPILADLTTEKLSEEEVINQMNLAPKDVSLISKWLRPGIDSNDLLVRLTQKIINSGKQKAEQELTKEVRGEDGLQAIEADYERWAKDQGIDLSDMTKKNEMFTTLVAGKWYLVNSTIGNDKWNDLMKLNENHPARRYYDKLREMFMEAQSKVEEVSGERPFGFELPRMRKTKTEMFLEEKGLGKFTSIAKETVRRFKPRSDDDLDGYRRVDKYDIDENGDVIKDIPLYHIGRMEADQVSLDISSTIKNSVGNMLQHAYLSKEQAVLWSIEKAAKEREVNKDNRNSLIDSANNSIRKATSFDKGSISNAADQITMIKDQHLYGEMKKDATVSVLGKTIDLHKVSDAIKWIASTKIMTMNPNIALSNALTGEGMLLQEAISGKFFGWSDWRFAGKLAAKEMGPVIQDMYSRKKRSKMGLALEFLNLENDFRASNEKFGQRGSMQGKAIYALTKMMNSLQEGSQAWITLRTIGSSMHGIKVEDQNGDETNFWEAFDNVNGQFTLKEGFTYKGKPLYDQIENIRERIIYQHEKIHGIYNRVDAGAFTATVIGSQMNFFRGWLFNPLTRRFDGKRFSERTGEYDEGSYVSMLNFAKNLFGKKSKLRMIDKLSAIILNAKNQKDMVLTESEKKNLSEEVQDALVETRIAGVKKARAEIGMILGFFFISMLAFGDDEEDEETSFGYDFRRYHFLRVKRELAFYSPQELIEIAKNPMITATVARDLLNIIYHTMELPFGPDEIKSGPNKGDWKIVRELERITPIWNQVKSFKDLSRAADAIEQGYR